MRKSINWNQDWNFYKGELQEQIDASGSLHVQAKTWEKVQLTHTWNALDGQDGGNDYYQGIAWYQKKFDYKNELGDTAKEVFLRFGAVNKMAEVFCNGKKVGEHKGGFSVFTISLTDYIQDGENEILVKANNSNDLPIYPRQADFTFFGGIYRDVELISFTEESHFDVVSFGSDAIYVTPAVDGSVCVESYVIGTGKIQAEVCDSEGKVVATASEKTTILSTSASQKVSLRMNVSNPEKWDGTENAYLYQVHLFLTDLADDKKVIDELSTAIGFRDFFVDAEKGFFLNGNSYPLHGVCRHQDREDMGWAITEKEHNEDMELICEIGANTIRLAHYQQAPYFYDLCDQKGMVVWAEIPFISAYDNRSEADQNLRQQMQELVLQNYNHPSICFWGVANEIGIGGESEQMYQMVRELNQMAKELDPTRLTTIANVGMTKTSSPLFHITDVTSYNEYNGWYEGTVDEHGLFCDVHHAEIPDIPLAISEYGADCLLKWHSGEPKVKDYTEEYQALVHEKAQQDFEKRPYIWATWLWNMFDFAADNRDEGGCKGRNNKGLVTFDRTVKKQAFYYYKACWSKEPFVYLCGKRFLKRVGETTNFTAYSNQEQVELWVNGTFVETLSGNRVFEFKNIAIEKENNEIVVYAGNANEPQKLKDTLCIEKVAEFPEEYVWKEEKILSEAVTQWFASISGGSENTEEKKEIIVKDGYLSVFDSLEEVYRYPDGFKTIQELVAKPMSMINPAMADRMKAGGAMSIHSIWNHISKLLPDDVYYLVNERLNKIRK